ncbi:protein ELYS [Pontoporia blainvillei]|uniref:Protein ELYS n=1 Tax=Pontoporia blainvillei TaxID=48723 RepID=A0ABX0S412_PONBL|nr:protein ELYS [Pontoporia blainvillei]
MGLMEDLLKLPFTDTEQISSHSLARLTASLGKQEELNDRDPRLRERSVARNSILDQYGKILPRVQRKLATERAKPYHLSASSVLREVSRPRPLSAVPKQAVTGSVLTRSTFISNVLSKIGEVWASNEPKNSISVYNSPKIEEPSPIVYSLPDPELPEAFVGTPISKASQKISRASELHLLETPLVVKKAKTLAMSVTSPGFAEFTPQSILRSGLRTTPLVSPSLSPGRSLTPPLRLKETRISFMEEGITAKWTSGAADDSKTKALITAPFHKCAVPAETEWLRNKDKATSFPLNSPEKDHQEINVRSQDTTSQSLEKLDVNIENSNTSTRSDQTTLEYQDAPSPEDFEGIFMASKPVTRSSTEQITNLTEQTENSDKDTFESEVTPPDLERQMGTLEDAETKDLLVAEGPLSELNTLSPIQGVEASLCVPSVCEGVLKSKKGQELSKARLDPSSSKVSGWKRS